MSHPDASDFCPSRSDIQLMARTYAALFFSLYHSKIKWQQVHMPSRDLKSKCAISLGASKDTREIFSLSALFLCCLCEIECAITARTDPSFDMSLQKLSSGFNKGFLHCCCEKFICPYFFQVVLLLYCLPSKQLSTKTVPS